MIEISERRVFQPEDRPLLLLALVKVIILCGANLFDGMFVDEFYFFACSKHLAFGYVDHPPLVAVIAAITRYFLGDSLFALRVPAVLAGAFLVYFTGRFARLLGGGRYAQFLAALAVLVSPVYLATSSYFSMNPFDQIFWLLGAYWLVLLIKKDQTRDWVWLGVILGLGLQNKLSVLFYGFGLLIAILLTSKRRWLLSRGIWIAAGVSVLIFLPHILWQVTHQWATVEFIQNATRYKNLPMTPWQFLSEVIMETHPFLCPLWVMGLFWFFFGRDGKPYRLFGWMFITIFLVFVLKNGKPYYLSPFFTILFAAGSIPAETWIQRKNRLWLKPALAGILITGGLITLPMAVSLLPVKTFIQYSSALGIQPSSSEKKEVGPLPELFADRYGWEGLATAVSGVYQSLSPKERAQCVIIGSNYSYAGCIDYFGSRLGLPNVLCPHNSYYYWGPGEKSGEIAIIVGYSKSEIENTYADVQAMATYNNAYAMPDRKCMTVYLCRNPKGPLKEAWIKARKFI